MKILKFIIYLALILIVIGLYRFWINSQEVETQNDYPMYGSYQDMKDKADLIAIGKVEQTWVKNLGAPGEETVYTISQVQAIKVYKSNRNQLKEGDMIEIKQEGGVLNNKQYVTSMDHQYLQKEKEYLFFLTQDQNHKVSYFLINPIQGSYERDGEKWIGRKENVVKIDSTILLK